MGRDNLQFQLKPLEADLGCVLSPCCSGQLPFKVDPGTPALSQAVSLPGTSLVLGAVVEAVRSRDLTPPHSELSLLPARSGGGEPGPGGSHGPQIALAPRFSFSSTRRASV